MTELRYSVAANRDMVWLFEYGATFGERKLAEMERDIDYFISRIQQAPTAYPFLHSSQRYRSCRLPPNWRIVYSYYPEQNLVEIVRIFDQRQLPENLVL